MPVTPDSLSKLKIDRAQFDEEGAPRRRWLWLGLGALALVALVGFFLRPRVAEVEVATVVAGQAGSGPRTVLNASGYVTARRQATVSSKVTGKVVEVHVEEGMKVEAGQVLARLEESQTRVQHDLARAGLVAAEKAARETEVRLAEAEVTLRRTRQLVTQGIKSEADLDADLAAADSLRARLEAQRGEVDVARRQLAVVAQALDDLVIRAPFAGIAISKNAQPGEMISPVSAGGGFTRTGISTIVDMASLEIEVDVNESYIQRVQPGQKVTATLDAYRDWSIPAHVITTIPAADRQRATMKVRIGFDALDPRILPDMGVKVAFLAPAAASGAPVESALLVPRAALRGESGKEHVLVVANERLARRGVTLAGTTGDPVEVLSGLAVGESVVVVGPADLADGQRVRVKAPAR